MIKADKQNTTEGVTNSKDNANTQLCLIFLNILCHMYSVQNMPLKEKHVIYAQLASPKRIEKKCCQTRFLNSPPIKRTDTSTPKHIPYNINKNNINRHIGFNIKILIH